MELVKYEGLPIGSAAPDFSLPAVDGKTYSLGSFKDKPILVVAFWCNHCPYVQAWEDRTIAVQKDFASKGVQFVAINANDQESYPEDDFAHKDPPTGFVPPMGCSIKWKAGHWS